MVLTQFVDDITNSVNDLVKQQDNMDFAIKNSKLNCYYFYPARTDYFKSKIESLNELKDNFELYKNTIGEQLYNNIDKSIQEIIFNVESIYEKIFSIVEKYKNNENIVYDELLLLFPKTKVLFKECIDSLTSIKPNEMGIVTKDDTSIIKSETNNESIDIYSTYERPTSFFVDGSSIDDSSDLINETNSEFVDLEHEKDLINQELLVANNSAKTKNTSIIEALEEKKRKLEEYLSNHNKNNNLFSKLKTYISNREIIKKIIMKKDRKYNNKTIKLDRSENIAQTDKEFLKTIKAI